MSKWFKLALGLLVILIVGKYLFDYQTSNAGYAPDQPIPFSHRLHAGDNKIPCLYCHYNAERSRHATIPSMDICLGCHSVVAVDKDNIKKITELFEAGNSVAWTRIHSLPDFVYFDHSRHLAAGFACQNCHGEVEKMTVVRQAESLNMGWCVDCHRQNNASDNCNICHQ